MEVANANTSKFYETFKGIGPTAALIVPAVLFNLVTNIGVLLNLSVVYVTIRSRNLRGTAHFLLALISLCEVLHQSGHLLFLGVVVTGTNFIDLLTAVRLLLPCWFGVNAALFAIFLAAADRLFAVLAPQSHKQINKLLYLSILSSACCAYGAICAYSLHEFGVQNAKMPVTGYLNDIVLTYEPKHILWNLCTLGLNLFAVACYVAIGIVVKRKQGVTQSTNARLLNSLLFIVCIGIGGYILNMALLKIVYNILCVECLFETVLAWHLSFINNMLLNLGVASNAPILYFTSCEYRKEFKKFVLICHNNSVGISTSNRGAVIISKQINAEGRVSTLAEGHENPKL